MIENINTFNYVFNDTPLEFYNTLDQYVSKMNSELDFNKDNLNSKDSINFDDIESYEFHSSCCFETNYKNAHFECYINIKSSDKLIIMLSAARTRPQLPRFQRVSYSNITNDNYLFIEDPSYYLDDSLKVAWYFGDKNNNFCKYTALLVRKIAKNLNISDENVLFFGSSCAGTAAIAISNAYSNYSTAVSINGQINFEYHHKDIISYENIMGFSIKGDPEERGNIISNISNAYHRTRTGKIILIENIASRWDYNDHLLYLVKQLNLTLSYPLTKQGYLYIWMYYAQSKKPHVAHDDKELFPLIYSIINKILVKNQQFDQIEKECQIINYIWNIHYQNTNDCIFYVVKYFNDKYSMVIFDKKIITINASEIDNYNHYEIPIRRKGYYSLCIDNAKSSGCSQFSIGIFNKQTRTFAFLSEYSTNTRITINFFISSKDVLFLDIFSGSHGLTQNVELNLFKISIKYIP